VCCAAFDDAKKFLNSDEITKHGQSEEERRAEKENSLTSACGLFVSAATKRLPWKAWGTP